MSKLLPAVVVLVPLLILPGLTLNYDIVPRLAIFELLLCAMLFCRPAWPAKTFFALCVALAAWVLICAATSPDRALALYGSNWRELGAITWISVIAFGIVAAGALAHAPDLSRRISQAAAISGILGGAYGILQYFGIDPLIAAASYHAGEGVFRIVRPPGTLGHADYFALWLVAVFFLAAPLGGWMGITAQVTAAVAIVLSGTRGSLLGLAAGAIVLAILRRPRIGAKQMAAFTAAAALAIAFFFSPAGVPLRARVHWSLDEPAGGARLLLWRDSLRMIAARPLVGYGPEQYPSEFPRFESVQLAREYPDWYHESPHNALLDAATSIGVPGLVLALALAALALITVGRAILPAAAFRGGPSPIESRPARGRLLTRAAQQSRDEGSPAGAAVAAGLIAQFVNLQFVSLTLSGAVFLMLFIAIAVSLQPRPALEPIRMNRWMVIPAAAAALVFAVYATRLLGTDILLGQFDRAITRGETVAAISDYESARRWSPSGAASDLYCSRKLLSVALRAPQLGKRLEVWHQAILAAANATRFADDRQNAWYNLALLSATAGDQRNTEHCLRQAAAISPNWFKPHWALARLLRMEGRVPEARLETARALALDGDHDPQVARSLLENTAAPLQSFYRAPTTRTAPR